MLDRVGNAFFVGVVVVVAALVIVVMLVVAVLLVVRVVIVVISSSSPLLFIDQAGALPASWQKPPSLQNSVWCADALTKSLLLEPSFVSHAL